MNYWLVKTEPEDFSISDLESVKSEAWSGVRNYQARNFMRDEMKLNDKVLIYHSSCKNIGIAGIGYVNRESYPDSTQFDKHSKYYDPKSTIQNPRWYLVDISWTRTFKEVISLKRIKEYEHLKSMYLVKKGTRLSVQPVSRDEFDFINNLN